jgi:hypothetical protein
VIYARGSEKTDRRNKIKFQGQWCTVLESIAALASRRRLGMLIRDDERCGCAVTASAHGPAYVDPNPGRAVTLPVAASESLHVQLDPSAAYLQ